VVGIPHGKLGEEKEEARKTIGTLKRGKDPVRKTVLNAQNHGSAKEKERSRAMEIGKDEGGRLLNKNKKSQESIPGRWPVRYRKLAEESCSLQRKRSQEIQSWGNERRAKELLPKRA